MLLLWKARLLDENLQSVVPARPSTILPLIRFLIGKEAPPAAVIGQWDRMIAGGEGPEIPASRFFLDYLFKQGLSEKAREQWVLLNQKAGIVDEEYREGKSFTWNPGFELPMQASPFDWQVPAREGYRARVVEGEGIEGSKALRIDFEGTHNLSFGIGQIVVVRPGRYRFSAAVRSENVSTDQGLWFRVTDAGSREALIQTEPVLGTAAWKRLEGELEVKQGGDRVYVSLVRTPSRKLDNKLAGTVWVDEVRVTAGDE
ncbi:MAG: hypothetical protein EHM18_07735 [Acidobacteria bacterium]|nr:MAG: hypothetical protein EHM18_07735 [Acidobacteriota bacterium]